METSIATVRLDDPESVFIDEKGRSLGYFCKRKPVKVGRALLDQLKAESTRRGGKNVRLCLHESPEALFHEMIILERKGQCFPPHKHMKKGESWHVLEGQLAAVVFAEDGTVLDASVLEKDDQFLYRIDANMYHLVVPLTEFAIYHEAKPGPFIREGDSIFAPWAPGISDPAGLARYTEKTLGQLRIRC